MSDRIKLQVALDIGETSALLQIGRQVADYVDWIEAGTPWIMAEGMGAVRALRSTFPQKYILADMKIMDGGHYEAVLGFRAGANIVTVLGVASNSTITGAIQAAREFNGQVMVDLIQVTDLVSRAQELTELDVDYICVHTAYDDQQLGRNPVADLALLSTQKTAPLVVAGGIGFNNLPQVVAYAPAAVVIGGAITKAKEPERAAQQIRAALDKVALV